MVNKPVRDLLMENERRKPSEVKRKIYWFLSVVREILGIDFHFTIFGYVGI